MADKQHLEAILKFAIDKGWDMFGEPEQAKEHISFEWWVMPYDQGINCRTYTNEKKTDFFQRSYSTSDILASHSFWKALVGEKEVCRICGYIDIDERGTCQNCHNYNDLLPANLYHISQCFQLPEEERLKYAVQFVKGVIKY